MIGVFGVFDVDWVRPDSRCHPTVMEPNHTWGPL
jgi:hypothetical protein